MTTTFAELVVDSGIRTRRDLTALLPAELAKRIDDGAKGLLDEMQSAAALRILVTIKDPGWQRFVGPVRIDWDGMLNSWSRHVLRESSSVRIRVEAAASLAGWAGASPDLLYVCRALDRANLLAVVDAMRIVADGGLKPDPVGEVAADDVPLMDACGAVTHDLRGEPLEPCMRASGHPGGHRNAAGTEWRDEARGSQDSVYSDPAVRAAVHAEAVSSR